ncbi:MAG TPA: hypothetical protein VGJ20_46045 [Xanthobacteraceae bacterium]|jgi:hypothetical protein
MIVNGNRMMPTMNASTVAENPQSGGLLRLLGMSLTQAVIPERFATREGLVRSGFRQGRPYILERCAYDAAAFEE